MNLLMNNHNIDRSKSIILIGSSGHAKVIADILILNKKKILGFTDIEDSDEELLGIKKLGNDNILHKYDKNNIELAIGIGSLPGNNKRWEIIKKLRSEGFSIAKVIDPRASISSNAKLRTCVQVMANAILQSGVTIGNDSIINTNSSIDHDCNIGDNCHIAPGVVMSGNVNIENHVHIGTGSIIIENVNIGSKSIIAAGSTIYKNIKTGTKFIQKK